MTGKELILKAFNNENLERVPWIPYTGVQVGALSDVSAEALLQSEELLFDNLMKAHKQYAPDGMPVMFDLQIEAEILGCELMWAKKAPPSVRTHPLAESAEIEMELPKEGDGRIPLVLNVMRKIKNEVGNTNISAISNLSSFTIIVSSSKE